jgi:hypothetical protein
MQMWVYHFLARNNLSIWRISRNIHICDEELQSRLRPFLEEISQIYFANTETIFINMDQTGIYYDMSPKTTMHVTGAIAIPVLTGGRESTHVTVALTIASNGDKLKPFLVFKGTSTGRVIRELSGQRGTLSDNLIYSVQACTWFEETVMMSWIEK